MMRSVPNAPEIIDLRWSQIKVFICVQFETISQKDPCKKLSLSTIDEAGANGAGALVSRLTLDGCSSGPDKTAVGTQNSTYFGLYNYNRSHRVMS